MSKDFWNQRYAAEAFVYGEAPNTFFAETLHRMQPGKLLLPAEGEGRNAVYAATQQWQVTAFDVSETAQQKCWQLAARHGVAIQFDVADAASYPFGTKEYDAIGLIFAHFAPALRWQIHQQVAAALKPGGTLMIEAFSPAQLHYTSGGPKEISMLYTASTLRQDFHSLRILYCEELLTTLDEGPYHQGTAAVVRLIAQKSL
jgi:SAM-dependent methyltransferase